MAHSTIPYTTASRRLSLQRKRINTIFEVGRSLLGGDSQDGRNEMEVTLRTKQEGAEEDKPTTAEAPRAGHTLRTVLALTDKQERARYYQEGLGKAGYEVIYAADMTAAAQLYRRFKSEIGLVLIDLEPELTEGKQAFEYLKWTDADVQAMIVTESRHEYELGRLKQSGLKGVLSRHMTPAALEQRITQVLEEG